ncbi:MAG: hypothetical protein GXP00_03875 [Alphaproteobacteria bacterium]|nr:hypothetical protein [Alphaproteobacteria bacterium]
MREIDVPLNNVPLQTNDGAGRITRTSSASGDGSAQQQQPDQQSPPPEKSRETAERTPSHETAVTIATSLSNLEAGSRISADYQGIDGEDRPLIVSETGTYVVNYDPKYQPEIDKLTKDVALTVQIIKLDRQIEARLVFNDPAPVSPATPPISIPVTLELVGLGSQPPQARPEQTNVPLEQQTISYQDLYRAEHIARDSAAKLKDLPLPGVAPNYNLYEKAVPRQEGPAIIQSATIAGNALIVQEQTARATTITTTTAEIAAVKPTPKMVNMDSILHKDTLATVIKQLPRAEINLPDIVRRQLAPAGPLDGLVAGKSFTLRIQSIAPPDARKENSPPVAGKSANPIPQSVLSGIVIAPGKEVQQPLIQKPDSPTIPRAQSRYPDSYVASSPRSASAQSDYKTLYVATPVSVIKFQSPIELEPGTVINFSLPDGGAKEGAVPPAPTGQPTGDIATAPPQAAVKAAVPPMALAPQPLADLVQNWQALSQIISVLPMNDGSTIAHMMGNRVPTIQNPGQMTSGMVFFLAAMGASNPARIWLGPQVSEQLEKAGQAKLLGLLDQDMRRIFRLGRETPANDWRPLLVPLQVGGDISAIPVLIRHITDDDGKRGAQDGAEDGEAETSSTRFIVELELSQFGLLQVDGLLAEKKLNIIIRSVIILPPEMKNRLTGLFTTALEISGYSGDLQFRENSPPELSVSTIINQKIHMFRA